MSHTANNMDNKSDSLNDTRVVGVEKQRRPSDEITPDWRNLTRMINTLPMTAIQQNVDTIVKSIVSVVDKS